MDETPNCVDLYRSCDCDSTCKTILDNIALACRINEDYLCVGDLDTNLIQHHDAINCKKFQKKLACYKPDWVIGSSESYHFNCNCRKQLFSNNETDHDNCSKLQNYHFTNPCFTSKEYSLITKDFDFSCNDPSIGYDPSGFRTCEDFEKEEREMVEMERKVLESTMSPSPLSPVGSAGEVKIPSVKVKDMAKGHNDQSINTCKSNPVTPKEELIILSISICIMSVIIAILYMAHNCIKKKWRCHTSSDQNNHLENLRLKNEEYEKAVYMVKNGQEVNLGHFSMSTEGEEERKGRYVEGHHQNEPLNGDVFDGTGAHDYNEVPRKLQV